MKIELKKLKTYPRLSRETTAFNAELWIDGAKAADLENDGGGGNNRMYFKSKAQNDEFQNYCKSLPPEDGLEMNADFFISLLVEQEEQKNFVRKQNKTKILFRIPGDAKGNYRTVKRAAGAEEWIRKKYPEAELVTA